MLTKLTWGRLHNQILTDAMDGTTSTCASASSTRRAPFFFFRTSWDFRLVTCQKKNGWWYTLGDDCWSYIQNRSAMECFLRWDNMGVEIYFWWDILGQETPSRYHTQPDLRMPSDPYPWESWGTPWCSSEGCQFHAVPVAVSHRISHAITARATQHLLRIIQAFPSHLWQQILMDDV